MFRKKGVSDVVVMIFFILLTILAVVIISYWTISMTKENLEKGKSCLNLREYVKVIDIGETCYNSTNTKITIHRGEKDYKIDGYIISISSEGKTSRFDLYNSKTAANVKMLNGSESMDVPEPGNARTYIFGLGKGSIITIGVIKDGEICESDTSSIKTC